MKILSLKDKALAKIKKDQEAELQRTMQEIQKAEDAATAEAERAAAEKERLEAQAKYDAEIKKRRALHIATSQTVHKMGNSLHELDNDKTNVYLKACKAFLKATGAAGITVAAKA